MSKEIDSFVEKLENNHEFPGRYIFKFIVKPEFQKEVEALVEEADVKIKPSSGNKYVSVTLNAQMESSQQVVDVYVRAKQIEGIISL